MKRSSLVALVAVAIFMAVLLYSMSGNLSRYTDFASARQEPGQEVHIVASWVNRDQTHYDATRDEFTFYLQDSLGQTQLVVYPDPKPANFEQAEKVVVIGRFPQAATAAGMGGPDAAQVFQAEKILMKCPSKYEGKELTPGTSQWQQHQAATGQAAPATTPAQP